MLPIILIGIDGSKGLKLLRKNLSGALRKLSIEVPIEEITDIDIIIEQDIYGIPALMFDGHVLFQKEIPSPKEIQKALAGLVEQR